VNCRILEQKELPDPAVAGTFSANFVEARLHTDGPPAAVNVPIRDRLTTQVANPWMVLVDPETEAVLAEAGFMRAPELVQFLESVL